MNSSLYDISVRLSAQTTGFTAPLMGAMAALGQFQSKWATLSSQMQTGFGLLAGGAVLTGVGVGLFKFLDTAAQKAMTLQTTMLGIATATGQALGGPAMAALQNRFVAIGLTNQMQMNDVGRIASAATQAGITSMSQLNMMLKPLADFGEVLKMRKGLDVAQSATIATEFAHLLGANSAPEMTSLVNLLGRALFVTPASPSQFLSTMSQFAGTIRPLYGSTEKDRLRFQQDAIMTTMLESQLGQGSRGGTQLARMVSQMMGAGIRSGASKSALADIQRHDGGIPFFNPTTGKFNSMFQTIEALGIYAKSVNNPRQVGQEFSRAFQAVGARQAGLLADPQSLYRLEQVATALQRLPGMAAIQQSFNQSPQGQLNQAEQNWQTLITLVGTQTVPALAPAIKALTDFTAGITRFAAKNPAIVKIAANLLIWGTAFSLIVGPLAMVTGSLMILSGAAGAIGVTAAGVLAFATGLGEVALVVGGLVGGLLLMRLALIGVADWVDKIFHIHPMHTKPTPSNTTFIPGTGTTHYTDPSYRFGDIQRSGHWGQFVGGRWRDDGPVAARGSNVPNPPGHTMPGVGGGGRSVPIVLNVTNNFHGVEKEHAETVASRAAERVMEILHRTLAHDEYYSGVTLAGSLTPGIAGY